jgi:NFU1 iron-sulfur cluster scaffold homolog, mitochondrial
MFIQTESTPNPLSLKFLPGRPVLPNAAADYPTAESAQASPLAREIFSSEGVKRVYFADDFITVTKDEDADWAHLKPAILAAIMDHFMSGQNAAEDAPALEDDGEDSDISYEGEAADIVDQIKELIETRVRPAVARDGGDIRFHSWQHDEGLVRLVMRGSCAGCPSSTATLKSGIENMLKHYVPEVNSVEAVL